MPKIADNFKYKRMKVFGIGLNKTGTTSLGQALRVLGFDKHQGCNLELTRYWSTKNLEPIFEVVKENNNFEDWPWPLIYKELYAEFEDAKFVLTKRSSVDVWYESLCKHSILKGPTEIRKLVYGCYMPHDFKDKLFAIYNQHNEDVIAFFNQKAPEKLLVISFEDGNNWEKLCHFLNMEVPKSEFPFLNQSKSDQQKTEIAIGNNAMVNTLNVRSRIRKVFNIIRTSFRLKFPT